MICYFCYRAVASSCFGGTGTIDYTDIPLVIARDIRHFESTGYPACTHCALFVRTKDQEQLRDRFIAENADAEFHDVPFVDSMVRQLGEGLLRHLVFWLNNRSGVVHLYDEVLKEHRFYFDLLRSTGSGLDVISFTNGVEVHVVPVPGQVVITDLRSGVPGEGNAARSLRYLTALADFHNVVLAGTVESHGVGLMPAPLTDVELLEWYKRIGFVEARRNGVRPYVERVPTSGSDSSIHEMAFAAI